MIEFLRAFVRDSAGSPATEYAVLASLIAVAIIGTLQALGITVSGLYASVSAAF